MNGPTPEQPIRAVSRHVLGWIAAGAGLLVVAAIGSYTAVRHVPAFYARALAVDPADERRASREMESRVTTLFNQVRRPGAWRALWTDRQINAYLTHELPRHHPDLAARGVRQPRVAIREDRIVVGFRTEMPIASPVCSVELGVFLTETSVVACRVYAVRAGGLPLPVRQVLDTMTRVARGLDLPIRWVQIEGDPVALVRLPSTDETGRSIALESVKLLDGELYFAGETRSMQQRE